MCEAAQFEAAQRSLDLVEDSQAQLFCRQLPQQAKQALLTRTGIRLAIIDNGNLMEIVPLPERSPR
jgi:hypothetical protein